MSWFRQKRTCGLFFVLFFLFLQIGLVSAAGATIRIMPLGDSITWDDRNFDYRSDGEKIAYRYRLWQLLTDAGYDFDFVGSQYTGYDIFPDAENEGHPGWTDDDIAATVYDFLSDNPADIILLHIGTNALDPDPTGVENILDEIDRYEVDFGTKITVILARIINQSTYSAMTTLFNDNVEDMAFLRVNDPLDPAFPDKIIFGTEVDMEDGAGIDYNLITDNPPGDMWDRYHPYEIGVDSGYSKMANVWFNALVDLFSQPANFTADSVIGPAPLTVNFADKSFGPISSWEWDFGDDSQLSYEQNPTHTYEEPGTYTVSLTVTGPRGSDTETKTDFITTVKYFNDVVPGYWAEDAIYKIYEAGITTGCSANPLIYCPLREVSRAAMAVFLERGINGSDLVPPQATGIFDDVPVDFWAADWIEQLYNDGITSGCAQSPLGYCPDRAVSRASMAVFLLRSKHGNNYLPPPATGIFTDVPITYWATDWIEQLYKEGITTGCKTNPLRYCPDRAVRRDAMAVFLVRTFGL